jgi:subtilisin family serine protease
MRHLPCFIILFLFSLTFSLCEAAVVSPDLQAVLQAGSSNQEVPIIVNLADRVDVGNLALPAISPDQPGGGKTARRHAIGMALKDKADKTQGPIMGLLQGRGGKKMNSFWITNSIAVAVPASVISELASMAQIASIELDAVIEGPVITPSPPGTPRWNIDRINAPVLWGAGIEGVGTVVASLDTGVDVTHPDLKYRWRGGNCSAPPDCPSWFDPYNNTTLPYGIPAIPTCGSDVNCIALNNTHIHGTHVMGIMVGGSASSLNNAIGVAPGAKWISAKIFDDSGNSTTSVILSALQWALAPAGDAANAPDIVNNSWTIGSQNTCDTSFQTSIANLTTAGIEVVFAAGNVAVTPATSSSSFSPANNAGVFAVGATDCVGSGCSSPSNVIAGYSAWGPSACADRTTNFPNVVAPGSNIYSSVPVGSIFSGHTPVEYSLFSGTSQSAPHVSGAAALLAEVMPALTPAQIEEAFEQTAVQPGSPDPNNTYGFGLLDVVAAYRYAFSHFGRGTVPQIAGPSALSFVNVGQGLTSNALTFFIVNQGTADLTIPLGGLSISGDFAITSDNCSGSTISSLSRCSISVTFSPGASGPRTGQVTITSNDTATSPLNVPLYGNDPVALVHDSEIVATYSDIQTASNDCSNWDTIRMQAVTLTGTSPVFNLPLGIAVSLQGGYDPAFGTQTGSTTIQGTLTFSKGTVIVKNVIVQ